MRRRALALVKATFSLLGEATNPKECLISLPKYVNELLTADKMMTRRSCP